MYHLYEGRDGKPWLSLIAPEEWTNPTGAHLATVRLLADHTWEIIKAADTNAGDASTSEPDLHTDV